MERDRLAEERDRLVAQVEDHPEHDRQTLDLYRQRDQLRDTLDATEEQLRQTYAEIERLNRLIQDMQGTKAWKLHKASEKLRGRS